MNIKNLTAVALICLGASTVAQAQTYLLPDGDVEAARINGPQLSSFNALQGDKAGALARNAAGTAPAPEPGALLLAGMGCMGLLLVRRRSA